MRVLVIAAHPDDEVLGCGATIGKLVKQGAEVRVIVCAEKRIGDEIIPEVVQEYEGITVRAAEILGVTLASFLPLPDERLPEHSWELMKGIEAQVEDEPPDIVLTHCIEDYNQDHRAVHEVCQVVFRPWATSTRALYYFEVAGSTRPDFAPDVFVPVTFGEVALKLKAWGEYVPEHRPVPHPRSQSALMQFLAWRGKQVGAEWAEAFKVGFQKGMVQL